MTLRECMGLLDRLSTQKIQETGEKLSLAGGDGSAYVDEQLSSRSGVQKLSQNTMDAMVTASLREAERG